MAVTAFVGPGALYVGSADPTSAPAYCETSGTVLSDAAGTYSEVIACGTVSALGSGDYELNIDAVQDLQASSLLRYSHTNRAQVVPFVFIPDGTDPLEVSDDHPAWTGNVLVAPLDVGGNATSLATASKTWKVQGVPELVTAPWTAP